jgi:gamma-glutamyl-gamma-aminobutyrate hydrolase PuuD
MGMGKKMSGTKPLVAVSGEECLEPNMGAQVFVLSHKYGSAISRGGGLPVMPADVRLAEDYGDTADALILTEGPPIHRSRYGKYYTSFEELRSLSIVRDEFEFTLFHAFYRRHKPVLGIGRGMEIINIALGGGLEESTPSADAVFTPSVSGEPRFKAPVPPVKGGRKTKVEPLAAPLKPWILGVDGVPLGLEQSGAAVYGIQWFSEWESLILDDLVSYFIGRIEGASH